MADFKFEVGDIVKDKETGKVFMIKERWASRCESHIFYDDVNKHTHHEKNLSYAFTDESITGAAEKLMQPIMDRVAEIEKILGFNEQHEELESILTDNDKEKDFKAAQYDRIKETMFMACGMVEDGDSIKYIIDPETIIDEILKIIIKDNEDREKFVLKKRDAVNAIIKTDSDGENAW